MLGFVLGALTFYSANDYLRHRETQAPPAAEPDTGAAGAAAAAPPADTAQQPEPPPPDTTTQASPLLDNSRQMTLFAIDAIFREWAVNALWEYDTTEVALWNPATGGHSTAIEVCRLGTDAAGYEYYYRRIPRLTRPLIRDDSRPHAPIIFTESEDAAKLRRQKENERWWGR